MNPKKPHRDRGNGIGGESKNNLAHVRNDPEHLFTALGICRQRYYFSTRRGMILYFDSRQLTRCGAALELVPDVNHWEEIAPSGNNSVDWIRVGAMLIEAAQDVGEYDPPPGVGPAGPGRPRLSEAERARRQADRHARKTTRAENA